MNQSKAVQMFTKHDFQILAKTNSIQLIKEKPFSLLTIDTKANISPTFKQLLLNLSGNTVAKKIQLRFSR